MSRDNQSAGEEDFDPNDLDTVYASGNPDDEYIVKIDFSYCDVTYSGYQILTCNELGELLSGLRSGAQIGTPNMPGSWYEEFDVAELDGAFSIHSKYTDDVSAMRSLFGESVGETSFFEYVMQAANGETSGNEEEADNDCEQPEFIDAAVAQRYIDNVYSVNLSSANGIDDDAAALLAELEDEIDLSGLTELSDTVADALTNKAKVICLLLNGLTDISDAVADSLTKNNPEISLFLDGLTSLPDAAAKALARSGYLSLDGLSYLSDTAAEALAKHKGELYLGGITELSAAAALALSKKEGTICDEDPSEWVASLES